MLRESDPLGEGAVMSVFIAGDPQYLSMVAETGGTISAIKAFATVNGGVEGDGLAYFEILHVFTGLFDDAGGFVSHDKGRLSAMGASIHSVDVAAADSASLDANQDVLGGD